MGEGPRHLVVVGGSLAGVRAVESARRAGFPGRITLVGAEEHLPYDRPPLSKEFLTADDPPSPVPLCDPAVLREQLQVDVRLAVAATALDAAGRTVWLGHDPIPYTSLVIATGAAPRTLPGTEHLAGVCTLRTVEDARRIRAALRPGTRLVVVGAGFIGSEVASSARQRGASVTIIEALPVPLRQPVGEEMGQVLGTLHARQGTELRCGVAVAGIEGSGTVQAVRLTDGARIDADLVVVGIGVRPNTAWLAGSGLTLGDGVECDKTLQASCAGVYAAGDVASWPNPVAGGRMRLEHWTTAAEQGSVAGRHAADPLGARAYTAVPYFWSDWYGRRIQLAGVVTGADEVTTVVGDLNGESFLVLYRRGGRLIAALGLDQRPQMVRYRQMLSQGTSWSDALEYARSRAAAQRNPAVPAT
jgi:NADPH-dependent 2,4-dienoyl-CoA reductase/sulfur reductase-like enzyme